MASTNHRAALLSNLRTGGVRGASIPQQPHSAAPTTTRFQNLDDRSTPDQELMAMMNNLQMAQLASGGGALTAGMDGNLRLQQLQMMQIMQQAQAQAQALNAARMYAGGNINITPEQSQAAQLQMEMLRMQHAQQQQNFQAQLLLQQQLMSQHQLQQGGNPIRRASAVQPSTAGPLQSEFDQNSLSPAQTRSSVAAQLRARAIGRESNLVNSTPADDQPIPMSATPSGRFNTRAASLGVGSGLNPNAATFVGRFSPAPETANMLPRGSDEASPQTPSWGSTTVISGGTPLGGMVNGRESGVNSGSTTPSQSYNGFSGHNSGSTTPSAPLKSDTALSWRRGSAAVVATPSNSSGNLSSSVSSPPSRSGSASPPARRSSPLSSARLSPPASRNTISVNPNVPPSDSGPSPPKSRPSPLLLKTPSPVLVAKADETIIELESDNDQETHEGLGSGSASNKSSPTSSSTPPSSADSHGVAREEASKRLYEGLGLGRPVASPVNASFGMAITGTTNGQVTNGNTQTSRLLPVGINAANVGFSSPSVPQASPQQVMMNAYSAGLFSPSPNGAFPLHAFVSQAQPQQRLVSEQPRGTSVSVTRQPRGPPSGVDELGPRNFASRSRRKAFGGVAAVLEGAAERREAASEVVAF